MNREQKRLRVLIVSSSEKAEHLLRDLLPSASFSPIGSVSSIGEAKRTILRSSVDVLIINAPLKDEFGTQFAIQAADTHNMGVLMLVRSEFFGPVSEKAGKFGVLVLSKPVNRVLASQAVGLLAAMRRKVGALEKEASSLQRKMEEIRLVNRAKLVLMEHLNMSEAQAHRYIEKSAMDSCTKRSEVAETIIRTYEN